jgi:hypothetical protein
LQQGVNPRKEKEKKRKEKKRKEKKRKEKKKKKKRNELGRYLDEKKKERVPISRGIRAMMFWKSWLPVVGGL